MASLNKLNKYISNTFKVFYGERFRNKPFDRVTKEDWILHVWHAEHLQWEKFDKEVSQN
jgi:hypothetical protein